MEENKCYDRNIKLLCKNALEDPRFKENRIEAFETLLEMAKERPFRAARRFLESVIKFAPSGGALQKMADKKLEELKKVPFWKRGLLPQRSQNVPKKISFDNVPHL